MDKKLMILIFSVLTGTALYQVTVGHPGKMPASKPVDEPVAVVDCVDCMDVLATSCEYEINECAESQDCSMWMLCVEDCVNAQGDLECYSDCDVAHSDVHSECSSMKSCMCDVCVGQCVDMCMADP